jgi:hypothetical protein
MPTYQHLGRWTHQEGNADYRLDLWDTGRTDPYGKATLRYALVLITPPVDSRIVIFEGEDFHPSPLHAIDSDEVAGALLSFFAAYGESINYSGDDADVPAFTPRQREALAAHCEVLTMWSYSLEGEES